MLVIKIRGEVVTFDIKKLEWVGSDEVLVGVLNNMLPEDQYGVHTPFLEGGVEKLVLDYTEKVWPELKVVVFEPEPPPPDIPGVLY